MLIRVPKDKCPFINSLCTWLPDWSVQDQNLCTKMQLSTTRVNFTNASVSQFNYVKFLSKFRSSHKDVHDLNTILGLHSVDLLHYDIISANDPLLKPEHQSFCKNKHINTLVPFVHPNTLKCKVEKCSQWYKCVILHLKYDGYVIKVCSDLRTGTMEFYTQANSFMIYLDGSKWNSESGY